MFMALKLFSDIYYKIKYNTNDKFGCFMYKSYSEIYKAG